MRKKYVKDTNYNNVFNLLAHNYWRNYYINKFESSEIYKKIHDAACNGYYELDLKSVAEEDLQMLEDFGVTFTVSNHYKCVDIKNYEEKRLYDITASWENINGIYN